MGRLVQGLSRPITHSQSSVVHLQTLLTKYSCGEGGWMTWEAIRLQEALFLQL